MANIKQHTLYQLVQSMDASEKAYFKKFAFKRANKNNDSYIALFDAVDKQANFDINSLKRIKKINASHQANLHAALNNLFKIVCQVLVEYRKDKGNNQKLFNMLAEFELFREKKLLDLATKKYTQIEEFVETNRMYSFIPYVYQLRGTELQNNTMSSVGQLEKYFSKLDRSKRDLEINIDINKLSLKLEQIFHQNGGVVKKSKSNDDEADLLLNFVDEIYAKATHNFLFSSVLANNRFVIQMIYGRLENIAEYMQEYFDYFDENISDKIRDNELGDILITTKNYAVVCVYLNFQDIFNHALTRLKIIQDKLQGEQAKKKLKFRIDHLNILNFALNEIKYPELENMDFFLKSMQSMFENKAQYSEAILSCMMALVRVGELNNALSISDEFVKNNHNERVRDQYISVRLLRAIIWFKKDVFNLYESEITSIYRKLLKADNFPFQLYIIQHLRKLEKLSSKDKNQQLVDKIVNECDEVLDNDTGSKMMKAIELKTIALLALS